MIQNVSWLFTLLTILLVGFLVFKKDVSLENVLLVGITFGLAAIFVIPYIKGKFLRRKEESRSNEDNDD